jgi:dipeptidyl aminopeptidase/acylaminoacyl peptidase
MSRRHLPFVSAAVLALALAWPAAAAAQRAMTFEDVVGYKGVSSPAISPDGRLVAFVVREADLEGHAFTTHLWRYDAAAGRSRPITFEGRDRAPSWAPDGQTLAFLSDRSGKTQIYLMPRDGGEARAATHHATPVQAFQWSPDGRRIAFTAADPPSEDEERKAKAGEDQVVVDATFDWPKLWTLDVASGGETRLLADDLNVEAFTWSPDGARVALVARPTTLYDFVRRREIYVMPAGGGPLTRLTDNDTPESDLVWAKDGRSIFYTAPDESRFVNAESKLFRIDVNTRTIARLAGSYEYGIESPALAPDGRRLLFTSGVRAGRLLCALDLASGRIDRLTRTDGTVGGFDVSADGASIAYVFSDAAHLPDLWQGPLQPFAAAATPTVNPQAAEWRLGETRVIQWKSRDGWEIEGLLTLPVGYEPGRRYPLMVVLHGGPQAAVTLALTPGYMDYHQVLAGRGWAVLRPNYRGGTNYGDRFVQGMNRDTGGGDFEDIMTGVDAVIAQGIADPDQLGVMGWSWGGISTGWIVTHTDRFRAASAGAMVSDHFSVFGQADLTFDVEYFYVGGVPWADPARYLDHSPINYVMRAKTPTLLLSGLADVRCPYPQSVEFYKGLKAAGVETELVAYPREPHVFREPAHQLDKMTREYAWFEAHMKK